MGVHWPSTGARSPRFAMFLSGLVSGAETGPQTELLSFTRPSAQLRLRLLKTHYPKFVRARAACGVNFVLKWGMGCGSNCLMVAMITNMKGGVDDAPKIGIPCRTLRFLWAQ